MISENELNLTPEDYDKAFTEVSFLLDMFVETITVFVGKSTPSLAVAAGRKMAANLPVFLTDNRPETVIDELVRVFTAQEMELSGQFDGREAAITINQCPIGSVCKNRGMEIDGQTCQMFHYYIAGMVAELVGVPVRPRTVSTGEQCTFNLAFSGLKRG